MQVVVLPLVAALIAIPLGVQAQPAGNQPVNVHSVNSAAASAADSPLTLERAFALAETANVQLQRALAQRAAVEGEATDARRLLWNNPEFSAERERRSVPQVEGATQRQRDWGVGVSQAFEIAGQQGHRRRAAQYQLDALEASIEDSRREVRSDIERRFVQVLSLQERIAAEGQSLKIIEDTALSVKKRVAAGEDSKLDGNLANVEAVRARNQIAALDEQLIQAQSELSAALALPPSVLPKVTGTLATPAPVYTLERLLASASARPLLQSLELREQAAQSRLQLERAARVPDVTVGLGTAREGESGARERITRLTFSVPLPLFRQNAGNIGRASTELTQAQIEHQSARRTAQADVMALWHKLQSLTNRVQALEKAALPALEENQRLSVRSLQVGEIGLSQLLLVNRQVIDGKRDLIDAQTELRLTRIALHLAAGWTEPVASR